MPVNASIASAEHTESIFSQVDMNQDKVKILTSPHEPATVPAPKPKSSFKGFTFGMPVADTQEPIALAGNHEQGKKQAASQLTNNTFSKPAE